MRLLNRQVTTALMDSMLLIGVGAAGLLLALILHSRGMVLLGIVSVVNIYNGLRIRRAIEN